jgi:hypothetical protein
MLQVWYNYKVIIDCWEQHWILVDDYITVKIILDESYSYEVWFRLNMNLSDSGNENKAVKGVILIWYGLFRLRGCWKNRTQLWFILKHHVLQMLKVHRLYYIRCEIKHVHGRYGDTALYWSYYQFKNINRSDITNTFLELYIIYFRKTHCFDKGNWKLT